MKVIERFCDTAATIRPRNSNSFPDVALFRHVFGLYEKDPFSFTMDQIGRTLLKISIMSMMEDNMVVEMNVEFVHQLRGNEKLVKNVCEVFGLFLSDGLYTKSGDVIKVAEKTMRLEYLIREVSVRFTPQQQQS